MSSRYKVLNSGRTIEGLPAREVLEDDALPGEISSAVESWREAVGVLVEEDRTLHAAESEARAASIRPGRADREAEVRAATTKEREAATAAGRACKRAAEALVGLLEQHADTLRAIAARLALQAHAEAVDAALDLEDARARFRVAPKVGTHPLVDDGLVARGNIGQLREGPLVDLDRVNIAALAEVAGDSPEAFGFVERISRRYVVSLWTTPRRAERLGSALGAGDWATREDLEGDE